MTDAGVREPESGVPGVLFHEVDLPRGSLDVRSALGMTAPAELDIGFGKGWSLREWAATHRAGTVLGVEKRRGFVDHAVRRLGEAERARIRVIHGDARSVIPRLVPDGYFQRCTLSFPDPWWKRRHQKRQVVGGALAVEIARLLAAGGEVFVQTDVAERAEPFRTAFAGTGLFDDVSGPEGFLTSNPTGVRSNRELRYEKDGVPVFRMLFRKR